MGRSVSAVSVKPASRTTRVLQLKQETRIPEVGNFLVWFHYGHGRREARFLETSGSLNMGVI